MGVATLLSSYLVECARANDSAQVAWLKTRDSSGMKKPREIKRT